MATKMRVTHTLDGDLDRVQALLVDPEFLTRKFEACGARDVRVEKSDTADGGHRLVITRQVTVDLPGFAQKFVQPTNTLVQTEEWPPPSDSPRVCTYHVEVRGVPSRIDGTVTLTPEGDGTRQDVAAEVKVSIPLVGGKLEKLAVDSGEKMLADEAAFTNRELAGG